MAKYTLTTESAFGVRSPVSIQTADITLSEIQAAGIWSIANLRKLDAIPTLAVGQALKLSEGQALLGLQTAQQWLIALDESKNSEAQALLNKAHESAAAISEQTDAWAVLQLEDNSQGSSVRRILERLCPLDIHPDHFPINSVARTQMAHVSTVLWRVSTHHYLILTPRSSALSFLASIYQTLGISDTLA